MKKLLYLLLLTPIIYLASCSSGKGNLTPEQLPTEETIVGVTWQLLNVGGGWFRLNDDYTYSTKASLCDTFATEGVWSLDGDVLENRYIIGAVEYVERSTIIEYSDSLLKFQADTNPTADAYVWFEACQPEPIRGCMDTAFLNFNPNAQCPDTCMNAPVYGCMYANALNYNASANIDDGSCCFVAGCMDNTALNYNANACQDDGSCIFTASIGDFIQGGIVFYLDGNGGGLIAAPIDQSTGAEWGCYGPIGINGAYGLTIGTGNQNTIDIEAGCNTPGTAADVCANLTLGGYSDWFLPSRDELSEMYLNIGQGSQSGNIGNFAPSPYWTSTQYNVDRALFIDFSDNYMFILGKLNYLHVRAVRAF